MVVIIIYNDLGNKATKNHTHSEYASTSQLEQIKQTTLLWSGSEKDGATVSLSESVENFKFIVLYITINNSMKIYSVPFLSVLIPNTSSTKFLTHDLEQGGSSVSIFKGYTSKNITMWGSTNVTMKAIYGV